MAVPATVAEIIALLQTIPADTEVYSIANFTKKTELQVVEMNLEHPTKPHYKYYPPVPAEDEPGKLVVGQFACYNPVPPEAP